MTSSRQLFTNLRSILNGNIEATFLGSRLRPVAAAVGAQPRRDKSTFVPDKMPGIGKYDDIYQRSINDPEAFWDEIGQNIVWTKKYDKVMDNSNHVFPKWFVGGEMNTSYNCLDYHVENGRGNQLALIHDSPVTNRQKKITYSDLLDQVSRFARVLSKYGVQKGDRVLIYMPMITEAVVAMLATARLGAVHSLVFGGFAAKELAMRITHCQPKVILTASYGIEPTRKIPYKPIIDSALEFANYKPSKVIIYNRHDLPPVPLTNEYDACWSDELSRATPHDAVPVNANDPLYLLYTSGTTGMPKAVQRPAGGHAVALKWTMKSIYNMEPGEVWWAASDLGWVVGHSYICYAPLLYGNTSVIYEGKPVGTPDPGQFFRVIGEHDVATLFTAPTAIRSIRRDDPLVEYGKKYEQKKFRALFLAGEHCDPETRDWASSVWDVPVLDHWWQTETGWPITSTCLGLGNNPDPPPGVAGFPVPGWNVQVINKDMTPTAPGKLGSIVIKCPLPPGALSTFYGDGGDERFERTYFKHYAGYYDTMDAGHVSAEGHIKVMSRADDVINVAGHRLSSGALEEAVLENENLAECAVIGVEDTLKGHVPVGLCVLKSGITKPHDEILKDVVQTVRDHVGPVASFKKVVFVSRLPKTRSGKVSRNTVAALANSKPFIIPPTIEDPAVYEEVTAALKRIGYAENVQVIDHNEPGHKPEFTTIHHTHHEH